METLKFKVGDKVRVKSFEWYDGQVKNEDGEIEKGMSLKILCTSVEETTKVQKKLFELGIKWNGDRNTDNVVNEDAFLLFVNNNKLFFDGDMSYWVTDESRKIDPNEILAIQLKEEKPKFDPKTLKPFDNVLVRDLEHEVWVARFFDYYENGFYYTTSSACSWKCCIPYCDETKHLHRTTNEAPEFYRI